MSVVAPSGLTEGQRTRPRMELDSVPSFHSRRNYAEALNDLLATPMLKVTIDENGQVSGEDFLSG